MAHTATAVALFVTEKKRAYSLWAVD